MRQLTERRRGTGTLPSLVRSIRFGTTVAGDCEAGLPPRLNVPETVFARGADGLGIQGAQESRVIAFNIPKLTNRLRVCEVVGSLEYDIGHRRGGAVVVYITVKLLIVGHIIRPLARSRAGDTDQRPAQRGRGRRGRGRCVVEICLAG